MAKEILLYFPIYSYTAERFINEMEANKDDDVCIRMNCPGGDVMASMGMIAKYNEHKGGKSVKVDGRAASMGAYICAMADDVECLNTSEFLIHRAAFPDWVENDKNVFTDDMKAMLTRHNGVLRSALENKIDGAKFKRITGKSFDEVFSMDSRIDVSLTADQAQKLGLVTKVIPLNQSKKREINALASQVGIAAFYNESETIEANSETPIKNTVMTIQDVKANAEVYAAIKAEIVAEEKDRIGAFAEFSTIDPAAVLAEIVAGNKFTQTFGAKMHAASIKKLGLGNIAASTEQSTLTPEAAVETPESATAAAETAAFFKSVTANALSHFGVTPATA